MSSKDPFEQESSGIGRLRHSTIAHLIHDLKNQLTIMGGCVDSLAGRLSDLPGLTDVADLQRALSRAFLLATDLLGSDAALVGGLSTIDLNHAIVDIEGTVRRLLGPGITLRLSPLARAPLVKAHPLDIERILLNLILNARDAMGERGLLTIETTDREPAHRDAARADPRPLVRLMVSDTGGGMPQGLARGLGLGSVYEIVHLLDGQVHFESEQGVGTRVLVDLPIAARQESEPI